MMDSWPQAQELVRTAGLSVDPTDLITALHDSKGKTQTLAIEALITLLNDAICHFQDQANVDNHAWQEKVTSLQVQNNELTTALTKVVTTPHHKDGSRCISEDPDKFGGTDKDITKCQQAFTIWCSQIEQCFISNAHVFISEHCCIHHITSLLKDDAYEINCEHFDTVTKSDNPADWYWKTTQETLDALAKQYTTLDISHQANIDFDKLFMNNKPFPNFLAEFTKLANRAGKMEAQKVAALKIKVSHELGNYPISMSDKPD